MLEEFNRGRWSLQLLQGSSYALDDPLIKLNDIIHWSLSTELELEGLSSLVNWGTEPEGEVWIDSVFELDPLDDEEGSEDGLALLLMEGELEGDLNCFRSSLLLITCPVRWSITIWKSSCFEMLIHKTRNRKQYFLRKNWPFLQLIFVCEGFDILWNNCFLSRNKYFFHEGLYRKWNISELPKV